MASNKNTVVISFSIALFLLLIMLLLITYNSKSQVDNVENFLGEPTPTSSVGLKAQNNPEFSVDKSIGLKSEFYNDEIYGSDPLGDSYNQPVSESSETPEPSEEVSDEEPVADSSSTNCFPRDKLTSDDLLPQGANSKWAKVNPSGSGDVQDQNFLTAGYHIGVNTVGQSLRNANLQLRYEPPNPQIPVSPWGISTIEPDNRVAGLFDIGSAPTEMTA